MKSVLMFFVLLGAQTALSQSVYYKAVPLCTFWSYTNGSYACSSYPMTEYIPDRFSLDSKIQSLEEKIVELQLKIDALTIKK